MSEGDTSYLPSEEEIAENERKFREFEDFARALPIFGNEALASIEADAIVARDSGDRDGIIDAYGRYQDAILDYEKGRKASGEDELRPHGQIALALFAYNIMDDSEYGRELLGVASTLARSQPKFKPLYDQLHTFSDSWVEYDPRNLDEE